MNRHDSALSIRGRLKISSPTDRFTLEGCGQTIWLDGPSIRAFLRLRRQMQQAESPPWVASVAEDISDRAGLRVECRCRGRTIASGPVAGSSGGPRPHFATILLAALRI